MLICDDFCDKKQHNPNVNQNYTIIFWKSVWRIFQKSEKNEKI